MPRTGGRSPAYGIEGSGTEGGGPPLLRSRERVSASGGRPRRGVAREKPKGEVLRVQLGHGEGLGAASRRDRVDETGLRHARVEVGELRLDPISRILTWRGTSVPLTPAQASLMMLLIEAAPGVVSSEEIWEAVLGYLPSTETSAVRVLVHKLRRTCKKGVGHSLVETVRGTGYRLRVKVAEEALANVTEK